MAQDNTPIFDYNSTRGKLILSEYGRNVQNMVAYIVKLPTKEERNRYAQVVIDLMGFLNPHLRDVADFKHKLWDHLYIISNYSIDVDAPYPKPAPEELLAKPEPLKYPHQRIRYKHYGKTIELMMEKAKSIDEPVRKQHMVQSIANFMKMAYVQWNKDSVTDESIIADLHELSKGELKLEDNVNLNKVEYRAPVPTNNNNRHRSNQNNNPRNTNPRTNQNNQGAGPRNNNNPRNNQNNQNRNNQNRQRPQ